jgi:hypothetical protein
MATDGWRELSDDELLARLRQRGVGEERAAGLVWHREEVDAMATIEELL